jgi:hypothetical protein
MHNLVNRSLRSPGTFHRNPGIRQAGEGPFPIGAATAPVKQLPKISEPVLNSVIPAQAGTQVA